MKKIILFFAIIFYNYNCNSQSINDNWILGNNLVNFENGNLNISLPPNTITPAGSRAIVSDEYGDMLFYLGNDNKFYDKNGGIISPNSYGNGNLNLENPYAALQNAIITPNPSNSGEFFVTTTGINVLLSNNNEFYNYSIWVLDFNDPSFPLGKIKTSLHDIGYLKSNLGFSSLATLKKADSDDFFQVVATSDGSIKSYKFNGYNGTFPQFDHVGSGYVSVPIPNNFSHSMMKISPDGSTIAILYGNDSNLWNLYTADFNDITGFVTNVNLIKTTTRRIKDIEFSGNSGLLYILMGKQNNDLIGENIIVRNLTDVGSPEIILHDPFALQKDNLQRASDGNIYFTNLLVNGNSYISDKIYKIDNSNDILGMNINSNYTSLLNNISYFIDQNYVLNKELGTIPELVPDFECVEDIYTSNLSIINGVVNKSAKNSIVLKNKMNPTSTGFYKAGNSITLSDGFNVKSGANVVFKIGECTNYLPKLSNRNESSDGDKELKIELNDDINAYPNPFSGFVNLDLRNYNKNVNFTALLYDINGKKIKNFEFKGGEVEFLDLSGLSSGVYVLKLMSNQSIEKSFKLIKN